MGFGAVKRRGRYWDDCKTLHKLLEKFPFYTTGKSERDFEDGFALTLLTMEDSFNSEVITQIGKKTTVQIAYCFGKNHRPDMTLDEN